MHCLVTLAVLLTANLSEGQVNRGQLKKSSPFCQRYNCQCPNPVEEIKCSLNVSIRGIDFDESDVSRLDLSNNWLEMIKWGDTPLNLKELSLRNNKISVIHDQMFTMVPHLRLLDLSMNQISELKEQYFTNLNILEKLNLSNAFAPDYRLNRELCELVGLKILDISYLDLADFTLECWRTSPHLVEIHLRYTRNVEISAINWLPIIGNSSLRLIDFTGADLKKIDTSMWRNMNSLTSLSLSNIPGIDKNSIVELLKGSSLLKQLKYLHLANISADSKNFPLSQVLGEQKNELELLDISSNNFNDDLNRFLFNQPNFSSLIVFKAVNNAFARCDQRLLMGERQTLLTNLEVLDLSYNMINDSSCFYSIKPVSTLQYIDLSHNKLSVNVSDVQSVSFASVFAQMTNLTHIDLSYNRLSALVLYFNVNHVRIETLDISNNRLRDFQILSLTMVKNNHFALSSQQESNTTDDDNDEDLNMHYIDDTDNDYNSEETIIDTNNRNKNPEEDDERFIVVDRLDLSKNKFSSINLQLMFQSIRNIVYLNMSSNPLEQMIGMAEDPVMINNPVIKTNALQDGVEDEILCIDNLDMKNCKIRHIPNLIHVCINVIDFQSNLISGITHLAISNYTLYFLDYLNLRSNNITHIEFRISGQKFKQDFYKNQNSPMNYFYGRTNTTRANHTLIDVQNNVQFNGTCNLLHTLNAIGNIKIVSEKMDDAFQADCRHLESKENKENTLGVQNLNKRLRVLFVATCAFLVIFCLLIIYYMCSDFFANLKPYERVRLTIHRVFVGSNLFGRYDPSVNGHANKNIGVQYKKLVNEGSMVSQIEINNA